MIWVTSVGVGSFVLVSLFVGLRLLRLASRTRQPPELAMGLAFTLNGGLGYLLQALASRSAEHGPTLQAASGLCAIAGCSALALFNWRVFRPDAAGRALFIAVTAALWTALVGRGLTVGFEPGVVRGFFSWLGLLARTVVFAWAAFEALQSHRMARRRQAIGLTDADTVQRFLWWSVGAGAATCIFVYAIVRLLLGLSVAPTVPGMVPISALGMIAAAAIWRTFRARRGPAATSAVA